MFKKIKSIKFSFQYLCSITLVLIGIFLISSSILKINLIQHKINFNKKNNELKEFSLKNEFNHEKYIQFNSDKKNNLVNNDRQVKLSKKLDIGPMLSLPKDLHLIKNVKIKKEKFINSLLPLIVAENQKILSYRYQIKRVQNSLNINKTLNKSDQIFIENIADKYLIKTKNKHKVDIIKDLLDHVDVIPNSIVLAQAANESGWGSSRFAREFNALFGQYTYDNNSGIKPSYREEGEKHLIKFFPTINHSIESYFNNINTHFAYYDFRQTRKYQRENDLLLDPNILIKTLDSYAEDQRYIDTIISIIRDNKLTQYDNLKTI